MHYILKHTTRIFGTVILSFIMVFSGSLANAELSVEDTIKSRKALLSKNYSTAKRVQAFSSNGDFDKAIELMEEMSENYITLLDLFPENSKEGFDTEALPIIWEEKDAFNLYEKSADDMIKLTSIIEDADDIKKLSEN